MQDIFATASRKGIRFLTPKGPLTVEDLWDLPLQSQTGRANLDDIAKGINKLVKEQAEETSFVSPTSSAVDQNNELALEVVKHIISVRVAERDAESLKKKRTEEKQKILSLIADKQDETLRGKSLEELQAMVSAL